MSRAHANILIVAAAIGYFVWLGIDAKTARVLPERAMSGPKVYQVDSQKQIYSIYKEAGLRGVRVVHLNQFLNMVDYLPKEENVSMPFPVKVGDVRSLYEKGIDSHNWLFIANRTGLVRTVTVVLPDAVFSKRTPDFLLDFAYTRSGDTIKGYSQDLPLMVTTLDSLPVIHEPVIINVDAGYFVQGKDSQNMAIILKRKCKDIRMLILSISLDEADIPEQARKELQRFAMTWGNN